MAFHRILYLYGKGNSFESLAYTGIVSQQAQRRAGILLRYDSYAEVGGYKDEVLYTDSDRSAKELHTELGGTERSHRSSISVRQNLFASNAGSCQYDTAHRIYEDHSQVFFHI